MDRSVRHPNEQLMLPPMMDVSPIKRKWLNRQYANQSPTQKLDIYLPEEGEGPFPVLVSIHGGAWMIGDKGDVQNLPMLEGIRNGYAVVCINYRLSQEAKFPAQILDCKAAIRFLRGNATVYHLDAGRIGVWGGSAGGHLAALLGTSARIRKLNDPGMGNPGASSKVQAVVSWYGPLENFLKMDEEFIRSGIGTPDHSGAGSPESLLLGRMITSIPETVRTASPMTYIKAYAPPFLVQHGARDDVVPVEQSLHFCETFARIAGNEKVTLEILEDAWHSDPLFETPENIRRVLDFFDTHLKK